MKETIKWIKCDVPLWERDSVLIIGKAIYDEAEKIKSIYEATIKKDDKKDHALDEILKDEKDADRFAGGITSLPSSRNYDSNHFLRQMV